LTYETQDPATPGSGLITMSKTPSSNLSHETRKIHFSGRKWLEWWLSLMTFPHHRNLATPLLPISLTRDQEITHLNICTKVIFWNLKDLNCINYIIFKVQRSKCIFLWSLWHNIMFDVVFISISLLPILLLFKKSKSIVLQLRSNHPK
jgi:hypothetical protein